MEIDDIRQEDEQLATLLRLAGPRPAVQPQISARVRDVVHGEWQETLRRRGRTRVLAWSGVAAAAAAVVLLTLLNRPAVVTAPPEQIASVQIVHGTTSVRAGDTVAVGSIVSTSSDSFVTLQLRNGGSLRVASDSRLRIGTGDSVRLEQGAIYFASTPLGSPIAIDTRFGTVRDVGTAFEVRVDAHALRVRVREGAIELQRNGGRERAGAGVELLAEPKKVARSPIATTGAEWGWVLAAAPPIVLDGNARGILTAIAREKGLTLMFADRRLADRVASISLHDHIPLTPDEALDAATVAADLSYRVDGNALIINRRQSR